jgi:N6-L-threonylcarbamoyladenine synthase
MRLLAIETSCDETAAAIVDDGRIVRSSVVSSQVEVHAPYGGVVPEIASRQHTERLAPAITKAMADAQTDFDDLDAVGVTQGPGLVGCLLVGIQVAKGIAFVRGKPLIPVHHIAGHIEAPFLAQPEIPLPAVALVVSGGHTSLYEVPERGRYLLLGRTRDDAAGEAFDKVAKLLGLGYPGGPIIERLAQGADDRAVEFRVAKISDGRPDFSFSGLKTAVLLHVRRHGIEPAGDPDAASPAIRALVASFQRSVIEALMRRLVRAAEERRPRSLLLSGGVAANGALRRAATSAAAALGLPIFIPPLALATDNAAMIGAAAYINYRRGRRAGWDLNAQATLALDSAAS